MRRSRHFFCSEALKEGLLLRLDSEESHHLKNVLRIQKGDVCLLCNGQGILAEAQVQGFSAKGEAELVVKKIVCDGTEETGGIHLFFAIPSKGKIDYLIEKAQEIGVRAIYPLETKRTVLKISKQSQKRVMNRWQRIAREAAKQSRSLYLLDIHEPLKLEKALSCPTPDSEMVILHPSEDSLSFRDWVLNLKKGKTINLFIGPEGGFTDDEVQLILSKKAAKVQLGKNILKADTAIVGVTACLKFMLDV